MKLQEINLTKPSKLNVMIVPSSKKLSRNYSPHLLQPPGYEKHYEVKSLAAELL